MNKIKHLQVYRKKEIDCKMYLLMKNRLHTDWISNHRQRSEKLKNSAAGRLGLSEARCIASQPRIVFTNGNKMEDSQEGKALSRPFYRRSLKLHNSLSWASLFLVWHLWKEIQTFHFCGKWRRFLFALQLHFRLLVWIAMVLIAMFSFLSRYLPGLSSGRNSGKSTVPSLYMYGKY